MQSPPPNCCACWQTRPPSWRIEVDSEGLSRVLAAEDAEADQSAVLADLPQEILTKLVLPLGDFTKADVEEMLAEAAE